MSYPKVANWIAENTATIGTGDVILSGSLEGFAPFSTIGDGDVYYTIQSSGNKECGIGTLSGNVLKRTKIVAALIDGVYYSSDRAIDLNGYSEVYCTINSEFLNSIIAAAEKIDSVDNGAQKNPPNVTSDEIATLIEVNLRSWSPDNIGEAIRQHAPKFTLEALSNKDGASKIGTKNGSTVQDELDKMMESNIILSPDDFPKQAASSDGKIMFLNSGVMSGFFYSDSKLSDADVNSGTVFKGFNTYWKRIYNGNLSPEMWGAGTGGNDTDKFIAMMNYANASRLPVTARGSYTLDATTDGINVSVDMDMSGSIVTCATNEGFSSGELYSARKVIFKMNQETENLILANVQQLKKGAINIPDLIGKKGYIQFDSDDLYINRNDSVGKATNNPVLKCEPNVVDADGNLCWPIYMGFDAPNNFRASYKPDLYRLTFNAPSFKCVGAQFRSLINVRRNNCTIQMDGNLELGQVYAPIHVERCAGTIVNNQRNLTRLEGNAYYLNYFILVERHCNLTVNGAHQQSGVGGIDGNFSRGTTLNGGFYQSIGGHSAISDFVAIGVTYRHHAHMNGWGFFKLIDCTHIQDEKGYRESIEVRPDYGSSFDGVITVRNFRVYISPTSTEYKLINCARVKHDLGVVVSDPEIDVDGLYIQAVRDPSGANFAFKLIDLNVGGKEADVTPRLNQKKLSRYYSIKNVTIDCNVPIVVYPITQTANYSGLSAADMDLISNGRQPIRVDVDSIKTTAKWYKYGASGTDINAAWLSSWKFGAERTKQMFNIRDCSYITVLHRTPYDTYINYDKCFLPGTIAVTDWYEEPTADVKNSEIIVRDSVVVSPTVGRNGAICMCPVDYINCEMAHNSDYDNKLPTSNLYIGGAVRNQVRQFRGCVIRNPKNQFELVDVEFYNNVVNNYTNPKYFMDSTTSNRGIAKLTIAEGRNLGVNTNLSIAVQPTENGSFVPLHSTKPEGGVRTTTVYKAVVNHGLPRRPSFVMASPHGMGRCWIEGSANATSFTVVGDLENSYFAWIAVI